ncbi:hypothetical protein HXX01_04280, partial [Candidatus Nomurabacteria bacterium]|nr:hypothetical protein [Candidatus Nomurabacteria bacterium]
YKGIITSGYLKNKADFIIKHPLMKEDGEYKIHVRAVDRASNIGEEKTLLLSIDKTAPRIGSFFMSKNGVDISPDDNGDILIYQNTVFNFNVSLENDTESASLTIDNKNFELKKDYKSQLWNTEISLNAGKSKRILMTVSDFSGNITKDKDIGSISASSRGKVYLKKDNTEVLNIGASITIQQLNKETNQYDDFNLIDTNDSSIFTNQSGEYDLVLPAGNYRFIIKGDNINTLKYTKELSRPSVVVQDFNVSPLSGFMQFINKFLSIFK